MEMPNSTQSVDPTTDSIVTPQTAKESRAIHRCEARKRDGSVCGFYVGTVFLDGLWRCQHHRPKKRPETAAPVPKLPRPPVAALKSPADAATLASWAAVQGSLGRLDHQRSGAIVAACREFRQAWAAQDTHAKQIAVVVAWERLLDAQDLGDRDAITGAREGLRRCFAALGFPREAYTVPRPGDPTT